MKKRIFWAILLTLFAAIIGVVVACILIFNKPQEEVKRCEDGEHAYYVQYKTPALCTQNGYILNACANCNDTKTETLPMTGHNFDVALRVESSCTLNGYEIHRCNNCGLENRYDLPTLDHTFDENNTCTICGKNICEIEAKWNLPAIKGYVYGVSKGYSSTVESLTFDGSNTVDIVSKDIFENFEMQFLYDDVKMVNGSLKIGIGLATPDASMNLSINISSSISVVLDGETKFYGFVENTFYNVLFHDGVLRINANLETLCEIYIGELSGYVMLQADKGFAATLDYFQFKGL